MLAEFKKFALRGNVVDMAVGIVIGAAFGKIVSAFVNGLLMPPIGLLLGGIDFSKFSLVLKQKTETSAAVVIQYGQFINTVIDFIIVAFAIFIVIKQMNRFTGADTEEEPTTKACPRCCSDIAIAANRCPCCTSEIS